MFNTLFAGAASAAVTASALAGFDGMGTISTGPYSALPGGEFTLTPVTGYLGVTGMAADNPGGTSFQTFCVEVNEHFSPGGTYNMDINTVSILGGNGGPFFLLDPRTAYLYWHFRNGDLAGYNYGAGRQASAGQLQAAIWYIQGAQAGGVNNAFVALADNAILNNEWSGIGDVRILNVYSTAGGLGQDQLTIIPVPSCAALLGTGGLLALRRRR